MLPAQSLRRGPGAEARKPASYVLAILDVVGSEFLAQRGLFIEDHKQVHAEGSGQDGDDDHRVGVAKDDPKADPPGRKTQVHRVANIPVETNNDQPRRRSDRSGRAPSGPAEVPDAAQSNGESEHRGNRGQPAPTCSTRGFYPEPKPGGQQPEPQTEERRTDCQGCDGRKPSI